MNSYNNFTPAERTRALRWLQAEYAAGRRRRPIVCDACGQTEGKIEAHSEDYSDPFGQHIGQYGLCYRCHQAVHNRFKNPEAWRAYRDHVREGRVFAPIGRNYPVFCRRTLKAMGEGVPFKQGAAVARTVLDELPSIVRRSA